MIVRFHLNQSGIPEDPVVVQQVDKGLDEMAIEALMFSHFFPAYRNGEPIESNMRHTFRFQLPPAKPADVKPMTKLSKAGIAPQTFDDPNPGTGLPRVRYKVEPSFSEEARKANFSGTVVLSLVVSEAGFPTKIKVVRGIGLGLDEEAIIALLRWRFYPAIQNGKPRATPL